MRATSASCPLLLLLLLCAAAGWAAPERKSGQAPWVRAKKFFSFFKTQLIAIGGPQWSKRAETLPTSKAEEHEGVASVDRIIDDPVLIGNFSKRQNDPKHFAEMDLLLVIDYKIFLSFLEKYQNLDEAKLHLKEYYEHFVGYLSEIFEKAAHSFAITIKPAAVVAATDVYASPWSEVGLIFNPAKNRYSLPAKRALEAFDHWLAKHQDKLPKFDHAMAVTKSGLFDGKVSERLRGMAWTDMMCKSRKDIVKSTSIITDKGAFQGILTAAHELGHSLGAPHDGSAKFSSWCPEGDRYLMSPALPMSADVARFSRCSEFIIKNNFRLRRYPCLMKSAHRHNVVTVHSHPGSQFDANQLCQQWFGTNYEACHLLSSLDLYGTMCSDNLICGVRNSPEMCSRQDTVPAGTACGRKSVCRDNRCVIDDHAPCCPLKKEDHEYCSRKMRESDENCDNPNMKFLCCRHCGITC